MASGTLAAVHNGENIVIAGLVIQILFFGFFIITCAVFHRRLTKIPTEQSIELDRSWRRHLCILYAVNLLVMIRSVFRLIEYAMGNDGYLLRHEAFLYVFDGVPILAAMILYIIVHPSSLIPSKLKGVELDFTV
ncbi:RTA-like protein [Aspergillus minisclerotigenes]|uniref:RTA-like protein n=1 Tax=Aspergillus minisclerotigenes TaxID=656917 RepID=A0A5N6IRM4_9EURO|nr:RTA-like protein [Aspergillus minisclerotigenes]